MALPGKRAGTVRWTSTQDTGDAGEISAEIEAWLARQPAAKDWDGVLGALRDGLLRAGIEPVLAGDAAAREILASLASLAEAEDPEALDAALARLSARVDALLASRERASAPREQMRREAGRPLAEILTETRGTGPIRDRFRL